MPAYMFLVTSSDTKGDNSRGIHLSARSAFKKIFEAAGGELESFVTAGPYSDTEVLQTQGDDIALNILQFDSQSKAYIRAGYIYLGGRMVQREAGFLGRKRGKSTQSGRDGRAGSGGPGRNRVNKPKGRRD